MKRLWDQKTCVSFELPADLAKRLRITAAHLGVSRSKVIRDAVEEKLAKLEVGEVVHERQAA